VGNPGVDRISWAAAAARRREWIGRQVARTSAASRMYTSSAHSITESPEGVFSVTLAMHTVVPFSDAFRPNLVDTEDLPKVALAATGRAVNWAMADMLEGCRRFTRKCCNIPTEHKCWRLADKQTRVTNRHEPAAGAGAARSAMSEDEERERAQGQTLPPHTALQLVLSYCVHHCYAGTVRVRPTARSASCQPHSGTRSTWLALPCMRTSVWCGVVCAGCRFTYALPHRQ
jgi:hypothetical protein